jgi:hypothetical protein
MKIRTLVLCCLAVVCLSLSASLAFAREWTIVGPRALGMGGANVAVANDSTASYWNPAAFAFFTSKEGGDYGHRKFSGSLDFGFGVQVHEDLGDQLNQIFQYNFDSFTGGTMSAEAVSDFLGLVESLKTFDENESRALTILTNGALSAQFTRFGIAVYGFSDVSARGDLDLVNIAPVTSGELDVNIISTFSDTSNFNSGVSVPSGDFYLDSTTKQGLVTTISAMQGWDTTTATNFVQAVDYGLSQAEASGYDVPSIDEITDAVSDVATLASVADTGGSFADNESQLLFRGMLVTEVPVTYGYQVSEDFAIGGNLKYMMARVYNAAVPVFNTDFSDALSDATDSYKDSSNFGVDLGALYRLGDDLRFGLVARNLNSPAFDMEPLYAGDADELEEKFQARAGVAYKPVSFVTLAADIDLTQNSTTVSDDYKSQNISLGAEVSLLKILQLRAGAYKNIAQDDIGLVYTAGFGLNLFLFNVDFGAALSSDTTSIDDTDIPQELKAELAISALF